MTRAMEHCDYTVMEHCDDKNSGRERAGEERGKERREKRGSREEPVRKKREVMRMKGG